MLSFDKALEIVLGSVPCMASERVDIGESLGRILAEDVRSDMDMPPFNKSAMDGYACRRSDLGSELLVIETIPAGYQPTDIRPDRDGIAHALLGKAGPAFSRRHQRSPHPRWRHHGL